MKRNIWTVAICIFVVWLLYGILVPCILGGVQVSGVWGDTFGAFSALINAIALIAIYDTLRQQRAEFVRLRKESRFKSFYDHFTEIKTDMDHMANPTAQNGYELINQIRNDFENEEYDARMRPKFVAVSDILTLAFLYAQDLVMYRRDISKSEFDTLSRRVNFFKLKYALPLVDDLKMHESYQAIDEALNLLNDANALINYCNTFSTIMAVSEANWNKNISVMPP